MIILSSTSFDFSTTVQIDNKKVIVAKLSDYAVSKLACNQCGSAVVFYGHVIRKVYNLTFDNYDYYLLPRCQCTNDQCSCKIARKNKRNITHVIFPDFIVPYEYVDADLLQEVAVLRLELDEGNAPPGIELPPHNSKYHIYQDYLHENYVLQKVSQRFVRRYLITLQELKDCYFAAKAVSLENKLPLANGYRKILKPKLSHLIHYFSHIQRLLLSKSVQQVSTWLSWPPWSFTKKLSLSTIKEA